MPGKYAALIQALLKLQDQAPQIVPFGARPGGVVEPEPRFVMPNVPGTRDRMRPPQATTDPKIKRRTSRGS